MAYKILKKEKGVEIDAIVDGQPGKQKAIRYTVEVEGFKDHLYLFGIEELTDEQIEQTVAQAIKSRTAPQEEAEGVK